MGVFSSLYFSNYPSSNEQLASKNKRERQVWIRLGPHRKLTSELPFLQHVSVSGREQGTEPRAGERGTALCTTVSKERGRVCRKKEHMNRGQMSSGKEGILATRGFASSLWSYPFYQLGFSIYAKSQHPFALQDPECP